MSQDADANFSATHYTTALQHASNELQDNRTFVLSVVRNNPKALLYVRDQFKHDVQVAHAAIAAVRSHAGKF